MFEFFAKQHLLDLSKSLIKQVKGKSSKLTVKQPKPALTLLVSDVDPILFLFRVKFYPADPFRLQGSAKLMIYQQLKRDLRHGRLYCSAGEAAALGALIVQGNQMKIPVFSKFYFDILAVRSPVSGLSHDNLNFEAKNQFFTVGFPFERSKRYQPFGTFQRQHVYHFQIKCAIVDFVDVL